MEFITLTKSDPEFESYLLGTFSKTHRALPVETFHGQTAKERVTFRVVPVEKVEVPTWWMVYLRSSRPELLPLTLGPAIAAWLNQRELIGEWHRWPSWFALAGLFFLHTAAFLFNDVQDHLRGLDRLNRKRGSQVIQKGWVSAAAMRQWALVNFVLAVLFGVPAFFNAPMQLTAVCGLALVALMTLTYSRAARYGLSDAALFLLFGPLLTSGIALASFGESNARDLYLGVAFGALSLWALQVRQFESLFRSRPESSRTILGHWDFDKARRICSIEGGLLLVLQPLIALQLQVDLELLALLPLVSLPMILTLNRLYGAASPLSSAIVPLPRWVLASHLAWTAWWIAALGAAWL